MTSNAPWSVKGIDPKAREAAKELARQSGMTLGEWLNRSIREQGAALSGAAAPVEEVSPRSQPMLRAVASSALPGDGIAEALARLTDRIEAAEQRSTLAVTGIDQSVRGMLSRLELSEREQVAIGARFEGALQETSEQQATIAARLTKLEDQAAGPRSAEALKSLEGALGRVASHLYEGESRTRDSLADLKREFAALAGRVQSVEQGAGGLADTVAARITERLEQAEARTGTAMKALERSFAQMDLRMATLETRVESAGSGAGPAAERRFEKLAADLTAQVEAARAEMATKLRETTDSRFDRMERTFSEMASHIQAAERRSAQAIETMGQEVLRMADTLGRRVQGVEHRSADAIEQVGGEVARVVDTLDSRLGRSESAHAQALEKLGAEIARITERLSERIGNAERRSAQAIDDVGEQVSRVTERLNQRYDRASSDLAERIRASEERTARLLEDAKERIDQRLTDSQRKIADAVPQPAAAPRPGPSFGETAFSDPFAQPPFGQSYPSAATMPPPAIYPDAAPFGQTFAPTGFTLAEPQFEPEDMDAASNFAAVAEPQAEADFVEPEEPAYYDSAPERTGGLDEEPSFAPEPGRNLSTRELIEQARAAARAAAQEQDHKGRKAKAAKPAKPVQERSVGIPFVTRKKRNTGKNALLMGGTVAALGLAVGGWWLISDGQMWPAPGGVSERVANNQIEPSVEVLGPEADTTPRAAMALDPRPVDPEQEDAALTAADTENAAALYADGARRIDAGDRSGMEPLRRAANLGYALAQHRLGKYYEDGTNGLSKNPVEARRWYERAAAGGVPKAMHGLATLYFNGSGGPRNVTVAAQWFRRAADLGLTDSQYNLGRLYQDGVGVERNPAEAYKWYLIAANGGSAEDRAEARTAANAVKRQLSADAQSQAERSAAAYVAAPPNTTVQVASRPVSLSQAQTVLSRMGYYRGEADGADSTALRLALRNFQRDQSLPVTGQIDLATSGKLTSYSR